MWQMWLLHRCANASVVKCDDNDDNSSASECGINVVGSSRGIEIK
jgi:hypothetical protein